MFTMTDPSLSDAMSDNDLQVSLSGLMPPQINPQTNAWAQRLGLPVKYYGLPNFKNYCLGPGAELQQADLTGVNFRWGNLKKANLSDSTIVRGILWGVNLEHAQLENADLSFADFTGANLNGANLSNVTLDQTSFVGASYNHETVFPDGFGDPADKGMVDHEDSPWKCA